MEQKDEVGIEEGSKSMETKGKETVGEKAKSENEGVAPKKQEDKTVI